MLLHYIFRLSVIFVALLFPVFLLFAKCHFKEKIMQPSE